MIALLYHLLRLRLQRLTADRAMAVFEALDPAMRAYGLDEQARIPERYFALLGAGWCWIAAALARHAPTRFWRLHRRWAWSRLRRHDAPVVRTYVHDGFEYVLDIRHKNPFEHYFGVFEFKLLDRLTALLRPDDVVFDIGANCGLFALEFAKLVRCGRVIAFEPNPHMAELLRSHAERNSVADVLQVNEFGIGAEDASFSLSIPRHNPGGASLVWSRPGNDSVRVEVRDFESLDLGYKYPPARLVKIDVEGFEPEVIEGMRQYLAKHRPYLFLELSPSAYDPSGLLQQIADLGYDRIARVRDDGVCESVPHPITHQINILCEATSAG